MDKTCNYNPTLLKTGVWVLCICYAIDCIRGILGITGLYVSNYEIQNQLYSIGSVCLLISNISSMTGLILICCSKVGRTIFWECVFLGACTIIGFILPFLNSVLYSAPFSNQFLTILLALINFIALGTICSNVPLRQENLKLLIWGVSLSLAIYVMGTVFNSYYICRSVNESFKISFPSDIEELIAFTNVLSILCNIIWIRIFFKYLRPAIASYDAKDMSTSSVIFSKYTFTLVGVYLAALCISFIFWNII